MDVETLAASLYRAASKALGNDSHDWEGLGPDDQLMYLKVAKHGPVDLEKLEGKGYKEAAMALHRLTMKDDEEAHLYWEALPPAGRLVWEIIARHLTLLLDADDVVLEDAEAMWRPWLDKRINNATA